MELSIFSSFRRYQDVNLPRERDLFVCWLSMKSQSTTGTSLERDEFAGGRCVALPILVQKDEVPSLSLAGPPGLAVFL